MNEMVIGDFLDDTYPDRIYKFRSTFQFTQQTLAEKLGVSFATVNRWENGQSKPSQLSWNQLRLLEKKLTSVPAEEQSEDNKPDSTIDLLDFTASPQIVKVLAEGQRLSYGHLLNPAFGTEVSNIDPLPHQRIAVYDHLLKQSRLRFLLADDAGAGKTIMAGLYIREMLSRRLLRRVLIITPAGLVGNWQRELAILFSLRFKIVTGAEARTSNPFSDENSDRIIISIDTLSSPRMYTRLQDKLTEPYDLAIFDEAHKLSASRGNDLRVRKTDRYALAEAIAGIKGLPAEWKLPWSAHHLLLLTATPHMGKEYPYYALWRLLEPDVLSTPEAFDAFPAEQRTSHFIRRTKEEMVYLDGRPLYPKRTSDTLTYDLGKGEISEQTLYDETSAYLRHVYNRAKLLNQEAARLAMGVFQRRLASSTYALMCSFERRIEKLGKIIQDVQDGKFSLEQLANIQRNKLREDDDVLVTKSSDEEDTVDGREENELGEEKILQGVIASSLTDLIVEREEVTKLLNLSRQVNTAGTESKFERLHEIITDEKYRDEKLIIFTEHRDTLISLVHRLSGMGFTGQVAQIHGGMHYTQRDEEVERFKKPLGDGGARFLVCTDAAGEGINLQFCWIMINYDVPWNPARLEQRMGRIHRYKQTHDVVILNLVAPKTREGYVLHTLLQKMEKIRGELHSDKVFDIIGRIFENVSIKQYMEMAVTGNKEIAANELGGMLTKEQVLAIEEREKKLFGTGGDVAVELPRMRLALDTEVFYRLLPGYIRQYVEHAAPLVGLRIMQVSESQFTMKAENPGAMDSLIPAMDLYPARSRERFSVTRPTASESHIWLHPGEPVFEAFKQLVIEKLSMQSRRGAIFIDTTTDRPYLFHLAEVSVVRKADPEVAELQREETIISQLVAVKQFDGAEMEICPVEQLLTLKDGQGIPSSAQRLALAAKNEREHACAYIIENVARKQAIEHKQAMISSLPDRENFVLRGFDFQETELAFARVGHSQKARTGNKRAEHALEEIKQQQRLMHTRREDIIRVLRREPELIGPGAVTFIAHALVVPSADPLDIKEQRANVEALAMHIAQAYEEAEGATVIDVHTPALARKANLPPHPGFDLLSTRPGQESRGIEVKGRAATTEVEIYDNEWAKACNMRGRYWLYVVYDCVTPKPRLVRVQDPFGKLLARQFSTAREEERTIRGTVHVGGVRVSACQILEAADK